MDTGGNVKKYIFVAIMLAAVLAVGTLLTAIYVRNEAAEENGDEKLKVVASFFPMYIAAMNIMDDVEGVELESLSEPKTGCLHDYQLTSEDMKLLSTADVFIVNGGGMESFLTDVAEEYPGLDIVYACEGMDEAEENPHVWMDPSMYELQVENITAGLCGADAENADSYTENAAEYKKKIDELVKRADEIKTESDTGEVVVFQEAFEYIANACGLEVSFVLDLDEERQVSAGEVADVMEALYDMDEPLVFADELYGADMAQTAKEELENTQVVFIDPIVTGEYKKDAYIEAMRDNLELIAERR